MKKLTVLITLFLASCLRIQDPPDDTTTYTHPTNNREWTLKKKLEALGYKDVMFIVPMNREHNYSQIYYLYISQQYYITSLNFDSVVRFRDSLCKELYTNVIEDSVLVDMKAIYIKFNSDYYNRCKKCKKGSEQYEIKDLSERYGFKVIRVGKGKYKRINIYTKKVGK